MRRYAPVFAVLLLLALLTWFAVALRAGSVGPTAPQDPGADPLSTANLPPGMPGERDVDRDDDGAATPAKAVEPVAPSDPAGPADGAGLPARVEDPASQPPETPPPAFRPNPRTPPPPKPGVRPLGGGPPPTGPTGLWEKFPPEIPRGRASVRVTVLDRDGAPVPGADVFVGPPGIAGSAAVSFGDLRKIGKTGRDGIVLGEHLPEGSAAVAGNIANLLNGPRGLDATTAVRIVLEADKTAEAEVRLPFALSAFGGVRGRVTGPEGAPVGSAAVVSGFNRVFTDVSGRFELPFLPAGPIALSISRNGFLPVEKDVVVPANDTVEVEIAIGYRDPGSVDLVGTVVGPMGEPVPDATVYVNLVSGAGGGTIRSGSTDEHGRFSMNALSDRLRESAVRVQANKSGYRVGNTVLENGLSGGEVTVVLPERLCRLRLKVANAASGEPLTRCRFEARASAAERPVASFTSRSEDGVFETWLPSGTLSILVEAPDHEPYEAGLSIGVGGGVIEHTALLVGLGEGSAEVLLTVRIEDAVLRAPVERARVEVRDERGAAIAVLEGERPGGLFLLSVPSAARSLLVTARGYRETVQDLRLEPGGRESEVRISLARE